MLSTWTEATEPARDTDEAFLSSWVIGNFKGMPGWLGPGAVVEAASSSLSACFCLKGCDVFQLVGHWVVVRRSSHHFAFPTC